MIKEMAKMNFELRFPAGQVTEYANQYPQHEDREILLLIPKVRKRGCLTQDELYSVAKWKAARSAGHIWKNDGEFVKEVTASALSSSHERMRIEVLTLLNGVSWPTASVILHIFHSDKYPILDFRALWSVSLDPPKQYTYAFWKEYAKYCRRLAHDSRVDMRTIDRALWQYSKIHQLS